MSTAQSKVTPVNPDSIKDHEGGKLGKMRFGPPRVVHVVRPDGRIQQMRYAKNLACWALEITEDGIRLSQQAVKARYTFLEDHYVAEGKRDLWKQYLNWWEFRDTKGVPAKFPREMLPDAVLRMREEHPNTETWEPDADLLKEAKANREKAEQAAKEAEAKGKKAK